MKIIISFLLVFILYNSIFAQWSYVAPPDPFFGANFLIDQGNELYLATNGDIFKSTDNGNSWINLSNGFVSDPGNSNIFIEFAGNNIFIASTIKGVYVSPDNGSTWQMDTTGLDPEWTTQVDLLYSDGINIFASRSYSTYGFYSKAATPGPWTRVNSNSIGTGYSSQVTGMTKISTTYYAATRSMGVYESTDGGVTWVQKNNANYPASVASFSFSTNRMSAVGTNLYVATEDGIYKSPDSGDSWTRADQGFATWNQFGTTPIMCLYSDGSSLFASAGKDDSAYVSVDKGNTWTDISDGLDHYIKSFSNHGGQLFATQWDTDSSIVVYNSTTNIDDENAGTPMNFKLSQNHPNPFNPTTTISYTVPENQFVSIKVYNLLGEVRAELVNEYKGAGTHNIKFDGSQFASGVYLYQIKTNNSVQNRKMMLIK
jgi:photosystem II stability/assembly factor-like uncharacterized protein